MSAIYYTFPESFHMEDPKSTAPRYMQYTYIRWAKPVSRPSSLNNTAPSSIHATPSLIYTATSQSPSIASSTSMHAFHSIIAQPSLPTRSTPLAALASFFSSSSASAASTMPSTASATPSNLVERLERSWLSLNAQLQAYDDEQDRICEAEYAALRAMDRYPSILRPRRRYAV